MKKADLLKDDKCHNTTQITEWPWSTKHIIIGQIKKNIYKSESMALFRQINTALLIPMGKQNKNWTNIKN